MKSEYRFKNGGDTHSIIATPDDFKILWAHELDGEMQLWMNAVVVKTP